MSESIEAKQLRSRLGSYLNQVQEGLTVIVTRQGQAIAELRPCNTEQTGQEMQNGASEEPPDDVVPITPGVSALGLTTHVCQVEQTSQMNEPSEEATEDTSLEQESQPEEVMQPEVVVEAAEADNVEMVASSPAKAVKQTRPSRPRKAKAAASPKRRQSRRTSVRKESS